MLKSIRITWYLLRIPRLLATLLLLPLITSVMIVTFQLLVSVVFLQAKTVQNTTEIKKNLETSLEGGYSPSWFRRVLLRDDSYKKGLQTCFWTKDPQSGKPIPVTPGCELDRFDVVVTPEVVDQFGLPFYEKLFKGLFRTIHICDGCGTDIIIWKENGQIQTYFRSMLGFALFQEVNFSAGFKENYRQAIQSRLDIEARIGEPYFDLIGFNQPTRLNTIHSKVIIILNIGLGIVTALWLALKAHRRVLDYLSHSGVLLPMVAATGKSTFYSAVWCLTLLRVAGFVLAAVPLGYLVFTEMVTDPLAFPFHDRPLARISWIIAVVSSFSFAALIASVAELKHNHDIVNLHYKLLPLIACTLGGLLWLITFLIEIPAAQTIRGIIGIIPVVGIAPILLAPVFEPYWYVLTVNTLGTIVLLISLARYNTLWFAAHLDDI